MLPLGPRGGGPKKGGAPASGSWPPSGTEGSVFRVRALTTKRGASLYGVEGAAAYADDGTGREASVYLAEKTHTAAVKVGARWSVSGAVSQRRGHPGLAQVKG